MFPRTFSWYRLYLWSFGINDHGGPKCFLVLFHGTDYIFGPFVLVSCFAYTVQLNDLLQDVSSVAFITAHEQD